MTETNARGKRPPSSDAFRPESYWDSPIALLGSILGENRRRIAKSLIDAGEIEKLDDFLLASSLPDEDRRFLGRVHPSWMGGEYLPGTEGDEVEIARIVLQSTTQDVYSLRARRDGERIRYRLVDEYDTRYRLPFASSREPLTQRRLVSLIDRARSENWPEGNMLFGILEMNASAEDREELIDFVTVSSSFYPGLRAHYAARFEAWARDRPSVKT